MITSIEPVKVSIGIEGLGVSRDAFYTLAFITENDTAPRTLVVSTLADLLNNGFSRTDLSYNFCVGVFSQQTMPFVVIRSKRSHESYIEAYEADDNSDYYYVVIESKDIETVKDFNRHIANSGDFKLQFYSQNSALLDAVGSSNYIVNYHQEYVADGSSVDVSNEDYYLQLAYSGVTTRLVPLPEYLLTGEATGAIDYGVTTMTGSGKIWDLDVLNRRVRYAPKVLAEGWVASRSESTIQGSDFTISAYKGEGDSTKKSTISPRVGVERVAQELLKGLGSDVLNYTVPHLIGEGVDWVLDPENNAVKYKDNTAETGRYLWTTNNGADYPTADAAADAAIAAVTSVDITSYVLSDDGYFVYGCYLYNGKTYCDYRLAGRKTNPNYDPDADNYKSIPIDTIAAQVISNASEGHTESEVFIKSIPLFSYFLTGSGSEALNEAVLSIDSEVVDWFLDPENNAVKYTNNAAAGDWQIGYYYENATSPSGERLRVASQSAEFIARSYYDFVCNTGWNSYYCNPKSFVCTDGKCNVVRADGGTYNYRAKVIGEDTPTPESEYKYLPIDTLAAQVISNAAEGHTASQDALLNIYIEGTNLGFYDKLYDESSESYDPWEYLPIYDVAVQVKRNALAGHAESIEAVNSALPFTIENIESSVTLEGEYKVGETLTAIVTDANGVPDDISYQWLSDGVEVLGATSKTYVIKSEDSGKTISVEVVFTDNDGNPESVMSAESLPVEQSQIPLAFRTESASSGDSELGITIRMPVKVTEWSLRESGVLVADSTGFNADGVTVSEVDYYRDITLNGSGAIKNYKFFADVDWVYLMREKNAEISPEGSVRIVSFSNTVDGHYFKLKNTDLTVPDTLPPYVTNLSSMFQRSDLFNDPNVVNWDVSNVTKMSSTFAGCPLFNQDIGGWNVSNVTDMTSMFFDCSSLKSDLSLWCVTHIKSKPTAFLGNSPPSSPFKSPVWGTCPRGEDESQ